MIGKVLSFAIAVLLAIGSASLPPISCPGPHCNVFAPQPGFEVRKLPCCYAKAKDNLGHHHSSSSSSSLESADGKLCSAYFTAKPQACSGYTALEDIPQAFVNYLNERDFIGFSTLFDTYGYRLFLNGEQIGKGACEAVELYKLGIFAPDGVFDYNLVYAADNGNVAQLFVEYYFTSSEGSYAFFDTVTLIRDACNNWVITLDNIGY